MKIGRAGIGTNMDQSNLSNPEKSYLLKLGKDVIGSKCYQIDSSRLLEVLSALYVPQLFMLA